MSDSPYNPPNSDSSDDHRDISPHPDEQSERMDSVPDMEQENPEDLRTRRKIDSMEDDTSEFSRPSGSDASDAPPSTDRQARLSAQADELERLANRARQLQTPEVDGSDDDLGHDSSPEIDMREMSDAVPDNLQEQELHRANIFTSPDELMPSAYYYRLVAVLPPHIEMMGHQALNAVEIEGEMVGFQIEAAFMTEHIHRVNNIVMEWAQQYLPLPSLLVDVHSEVWGNQQYITGWRLNHRTRWHQAQNDLTTKLASLTVPAPNTSATFRPYIALLEQTPAEKFPHLVAHLQANFEREEFQIEAVEMLRQPRPEFERRVEAEARTWQSFQRFSAKQE